MEGKGDDKNNDRALVGYLQDFDPQNFENLFGGENLMKILAFIRKNLAYLIPLALMAGLVKGHFAPMGYSRIICISALLLMIFPVFVNLELAKGFRELKNHKKTLTLAALVNFALIPLIAFGLGRLFLQNEPAMWLGLTLLALVPTSGMTINWTYYTKGNMAVAMGVVSSSILLSVVLLPFVVPAATGYLLRTENVQVDQLVILEKLFFVIVLPIIFGSIVRSFILRHRGVEAFRALKPINSGISALGVLFVAFLVMSLESTQVMLENTAAIGTALATIGLFYGIIFVTSHILSRWLFQKAESSPFFFGTAARYHVITLGVALGSFNNYDFISGVVITIAVGLAIQIPALAFYARWLQSRSERSGISAEVNSET
jgi:ACR3 family arsenite transporter